jgi:hypothetical protein
MTVDLTKYVKGYVTGCTALAMNGMSQFPTSILHIITPDSCLHGRGTGRFKWIYDPEYDTENFLDYPFEENKELLVPNAERSLLDYMRFGNYMSLEHLYMGMRDYLALYGGTWEKLYKMADFYAIPHSLIDHWVQEYDEAYLH